MGSDNSDVWDFISCLAGALCCICECILDESSRSRRGTTNGVEKSKKLKDDENGKNVETEAEDKKENL